MLALRECVLHFTPYGFRATWHHLLVSAGVPVWLEDDPDSLLRALDELEEARNLWLAETRAFAARRRTEKAAGHRAPRAADSWRTSWMTHSPAPEAHSNKRLIEVVAHLIEHHHIDAAPALDPRTALPWPLIWQRAIRRGPTIGGGDITRFRAEFSPAGADRRFGTFQLYVRGTALGDSTTTALYPHLSSLRSLSDAAASSGPRPPSPLFLDDTFDHLTMTLELTEEDMAFAFTTRPLAEWGNPPPWSPPPGRTLRLLVPRADVTAAWHEAEPKFERLLS
ncbi:hypothetical protein SAMN05421748_107258 [Paractinoplanes atraurantiacus]|uniref:Uncharacterized protein n=2 Tax=Paractinoplanes atraurantiacus TaxID=1036182 RepID=A0A285ICB4_9ACTN|nr:hypothetical protein SAMN05421748_107258 [Actinoplanes atraurantiacus]